MRVHILVVDDDRFMQELLPPILSRGFSDADDVVVETAGTAEDALARVEAAGTADALVVLSDYNLKARATGLDLLREVALRRPDAVRILFSGHSRDEIRGLDDEGLDGFLEKPFRLDEILAPFCALVERALPTAGSARGLHAAAPASSRRANAARELGDKEMMTALVNAASRGEIQRAGTLEDEARRRGAHESAQHQTIAALAWQNRVLEMIATGAPLAETLAMLARSAQDQSAGLRASILLVDPSGKRLVHGAAPTLPDAFNAAMDGMPIAAGMGSCGTAAHEKRRIIVTDVRTDPLWSSFQDLARAHGIISCWSHPILSARGQVLGTFDLYGHEARAPTEGELQLIELSSNLARAAIESERDRHALRSAEARWRAMTESAPMGVLQATPEGSLTYANRRAAEMIGIRPEDFMGPDWATWVHEEDRDSVVRSWMDAMAAGADWEMTFRFRGPAGRTVWTHARAAPVREGARLLGYVAALEDVTTRLTQERALRASEERYRALYDDMPVMYFTLGEDGAILGVNRFGARELGYEPDELLGRSMLVLFHPHDRPLVEGEFRAFLESGAPQTSWEHRKIRKDGSMLWAGELVHASTDSSGQRVVLIACHDITERKRAEAEAARFQRRLEQILASAQEGIYGVDSEGVTTFMNPAALASLGLRLEDAIGHKLHDKIHRAYPDGTPYPASACPIYQAAHGGPMTERKGEVFFRASGESFPIEYVTSPIEENGHSVGAVTVFRDVTEQMRSQESLRLSEERFRLVAEATNDAVWDWELKTNALLWNGGFEALFGYAPSDTEPGIESWTKHIHPDDAARVDAEIHRVIDGGGTSWSDEYRFQRKDGSFAHILDRGSIIRDANGRPLRMVGAMLDITEHKEARRLDKKEGERMRAMLMQAPAVILLFEGPDHVVTLMNPDAERALGQEASKALGKPIGDVLPGLAEQGFIDLLDGVRATGEPFQARAAPVVLLQDGKPKEMYFDFVYQALRGSDGRVETIMVHAVDVTEQVKARRQSEAMAQDLERRVHERTSALEAANRELEAFNAAVSHDLRAPLRALLYTSEAVLEDHAQHLDAEGAAALRMIAASATSMSQLVEALLGLSRAGRQEMREQPLDISALAESIVATLRRNEPNRDVRVTIAKGLAARGDERLVKLALENILGNAWKFTRKTTPAVIEVGCESTSGGPVFFIRDNGAGFDPARAHELFVPFKRLHTDRDFEGTGVGLATVARIIARHGGRIWAEAALGKGATFYFTLGAARKG